MKKQESDDSLNTEISNSLANESSDSIISIDPLPFKRKRRSNLRSMDSGMLGPSLHHQFIREFNIEEQARRTKEEELPPPQEGSY